MSIMEIAEVVVVEAIIADINNTKSVQKHKNFLHTFGYPLYSKSLNFTVPEVFPA